MKKLLILTLLIFCVAGMSGCFESTPTTLTITGVVSESASTAVIAGATVNAYVNSVKTDEATTSLSGVYSIVLSNLATGDDIRLDFIKAGYSSQSESFLKTSASSMILDAALTMGIVPNATLGGYASLMNLVPPLASVKSGSAKVVTKKALPMPVATEVLIKPRGGVKVGLINEALAKRGTRIKSSVYEAGYLVVPLPKGKTADQFSEELMSEGWIEFVEPNSYASVSSTLSIPNDTYFATNQWNMYATSMPLVWDLNAFSNPVTIAIIDTGVYGNHPDLAGRVVDYIDTVKNPGDTGYNVDEHGHGTHVAGIIAAIVNNGQYIAGMNHAGASILAVRSMGADGFGTADQIVRGIRAAADYGVDIISMSLGWTDGVPVQAVVDALNYADSRVQAIFAAAGNAGGGQIDFPANQSNVICVGSIDSSFGKSDLSNYGSQMDFAAPGGSLSPNEYIYSTYPDPSFSYIGGMRGTSQATPHVAALFGMMLQNGLNGDAALAQIANTAQYNDRNSLYYGNGIINAYAALMDLTMDKALFWLADPSTGNAVTGGYYGAINRSFEVVCEPGSYWLVGWLDADGDGTLNQGDYSGLLPVTIVSGVNSLTEVLEIKWMSSDTIGSSISGKINLGIPSMNN